MHGGTCCHDRCKTFKHTPVYSSCRLLRCQVYNMKVFRPTSGTSASLFIISLPLQFSLFLYLTGHSLRKNLPITLKKKAFLFFFVWKERCKKIITSECALVYFSRLFYVPYSWKFPSRKENFKWHLYCEVKLNHIEKTISVFAYSVDMSLLYFTHFY